MSPGTIAAHTFPFEHRDELDVVETPELAAGRSEHRRRGRERPDFDLLVGQVVQTRRVAGVHAEMMANQRPQAAARAYQR